MPISDLLASITGEKSTTSPTTPTRPSSAVPKRKAEDELRGPAIKNPRTEPVTNGSSRPNGDSSKALSRPVDKPASTTTASKPSLNSANSSTSPKNQVSRNTGTSSSSKPAARPPSTTNGKPMPSRAPTNGSATADRGLKPPTKKGSYAEIMARAKANQALSQSFGKIQHKTVEKGPSMKERKELKAEETRRLKKGGRPGQLAGRTGTTSLASRPGPTSATSRRPLTKPSGISKRDTAKGKPSTGSGGEDKEKKIKKAALATTGYTGTARPRPGASSSKPGSLLSSQRNGTSRPRPGGFGGPFSSLRRRDEEDDEMDDFIVPDEDDDEPPYGGGGRGEPVYYSEDESDMEAGLSDIDEEEQRAARLAREEDRREEMLEAKLKREKELRKKQLGSGRGR